MKTAKLRFGGVPSFGKFVKWAMVLCFSFILGVVIFASEGDDYLFLFNSIKDSTGAMMGSFGDKVKNALGLSSGGVNGVKKADGSLNLDLIDRIPDVSSGKVGYIKELLSIYRDGQEGKISKYKWLSLSAMLGMHANEVGTDSNGIPNYYFKAGEWKKNAPNKCLMDYTSNSPKTGALNESGGYGVFQNETLSGAEKSKVDPLSLKRGASPSDVRFLPDMIATANAKINAALDNKAYKKLSKDQLSFFAGFINNRGSGGAPNSMVGICGNNDHFRDKMYGTDHANALNKHAIESTVVPVYNTICGFFSKHPEVKITKMAGWDDPKKRAAAVLILLQEDNWFCNDQALRALRKYEGSTSAVWNVLFPKNKYSSSKLEKLINKHTKKLPDAINQINGSHVSEEDCKHVYGTVGYYTDPGSYAYYHGDKPGCAVYRVSTVKDNGVYTHKYTDGSAPYYVSAFDYVGAGYLLSVVPPMGEAMYAKLLKIAGVNSVDPTNPDSYKNNTSTAIAASWSGELNSHLKGANIDKSKLTPDRIAVLNAAAEMAYEAPFFYGSTRGANGRLIGHFYWCTIKGNQLSTNGSGDTGFGTDCAHYCGLAYYYAGFNVTYLSTSSMLGSRYYKQISFSAIKPGDILLKPGVHAVIYLSGKSLSNVSVIEARGRSGGSIAYDKQVSITPKKNCSAYIVIRNKDIDKGKRGNARSIPHSKPKTEAKRLHPYGTYGP